MGSRQKMSYRAKHWSFVLPYGGANLTLQSCRNFLATWVSNTCEPLEVAYFASPGQQELIGYICFPSRKRISFFPALLRDCVARCLAHKAFKKFVLSKPSHQHLGIWNSSYVGQRNDLHLFLHDLKSNLPDEQVLERHSFVTRRYTQWVTQNFLHYRKRDPLSRNPQVGTENPFHIDKSCNETTTTTSTLTEGRDELSGKDISLYLLRKVRSCMSCLGEKIIAAAGPSSRKA